MGSSSRDSKMSCVLCDKNLDIRRDSGSLVTEHGIMCIACGLEYKTKKANLKEESKKWIIYELKKWFRKTRSVKRFYKRQRKLPLNGGDK